MSATLATQVVSPLLVGRDAHLAALDELIGRACGGAGRIVLISGEAGIGKSRLVAEAQARFLSRAPAGLALRGACFEPDRSLPYGPILDLLRAFAARQPPEALAATLAAAPELVSLLPELEGRLQGTATLADDPAQRQRQLFEAVIRFIQGLASAGPLLVVLEDLHWCDDVTLDLLPRLARRLAEQPFLLALTWRSDEPTPALTRALGHLTRERLGVELPLARLDAGQVERMLRAIFGQPQPIRSDFLRSLLELTDGNPFFIEEVLTSLIAAGDIYRTGALWTRRDLRDLRIPHSVQEAVARRAGQLNPPARRLLDLAAVAGQRMDVAVLLALSGKDEAELLEQLRELVAARLVVDVSAEQLAFRHALTRQAVYAELLARERRALHRAVAETLERLHADMPEPVLADLAYHFHAAEDWERAVQYARLAGERALALYAPGAAVEQYGRALDAAGRLSGVPTLAIRDLHSWRGRAWATLGEFEPARQDHEAALTLARAARDWQAEWQSFIDLGELWAGRDYDRAGEQFERAAALARASGDDAILAASLIRLGNWHSNVDRVDEAEACLRTALATFERIGNRPGVALTLDLLGIVADLGGDVYEMAKYFEQAIALYRELGDRAGLASALATMVCQPGATVFDAVVTPLAPREEEDHATVARGHEARAIAREIGWSAGEAYALLILGCHHEARGQLGRALPLADEGLRLAVAIEHRQWMTVGYLLCGALRYDLLDMAQARTELELAHALGRESGSRNFLHLTTGRLVSACLAEGDIARAAAILAALDPDLPLRTIGQRTVSLARAELALARGDADEAFSLTDRLLATALNLTGEGDIPLVALRRGEALAALGRAAEAERTLRAASEGAARRRMRPVHWRIHLALARLLHAAGRTAEAAREQEAALAVAGEMAAGLDDEQGAAFMERVRRLLPAPAAQTGPRDILTRRERDIAALIAEGLTNREMAERLFIAERTVETHVGHILAKLSFSNRAQIAAWVVANNDNA